MNRVLLFSIVFLAIGCASKQPNLTRQEWLQVTTQTYQGLSKDQAIELAERILRYADGDRFQIVQLPDGMHASRRTEQWDIRAADTPQGAQVSFYVNSQRGSMGVAPTYNLRGQVAGVTPYQSGVRGGPVMGTALYELFWARLSFLAGQRKDWLTCAEAQRHIDDEASWGSIDPLCDGAMSALPEGWTIACPPKHPKLATIPGEREPLCVSSDDLADILARKRAQGIIIRPGAITIQ